VTFTVPAPTGAVTSVGVTMTVSHPFAGDVDVQLVAPDGVTAHTIFSRTGRFGTSVGDGSNLTGPYTFSDSAPPSPTWWEAAFAVGDDSVIGAGSFRTSTRGVQPGSSGGANTLMNPAFAGLSSGSGTWILRFRDECSGDVGTVQAATLLLDTAPPPTAEGGGPSGGDTQPPDTTITQAPKAKSKSKSATFAFTSTEPVSFECKLDDGAFAACTSPKTYSGLKKGVHTFSVRATDAAGNVDPSPATATWTVKKKKRK
jgi:subtilisin-like proprotein convertase family protein